MSAPAPPSKRYLWSLEGTPAQQQIIRTALDRIRFPWDRLTRTIPRPLIGWDDLSRFAQAAPRAHGEHSHEPTGDPVPIFIEGREAAAGVFYPGTGRIYLDHSMEADPLGAQSVVSAELAHLVDEFLPLSDAQRSSLIALVHPEGADGHTWWEKVSYGAEYWTLVGETFMLMFTAAYTDFSFRWPSFAHQVSADMVPRIREIVGVQPLPVVYRIGDRNKYHRETCPVLTRWRKAGSVITEFSRPDLALEVGAGPCRLCKP